MSLSSEQATNGRPDADLKDRYRRVRQQSLYLCESLQTEDFVAQSMPDVSPTKWHLAHTTWFFETFVLCEHAPGYRPFDARFNYLFNGYYEAAGPRHPRAERGLLTRPTLEEVHAYRAHVDAGMEALLTGAAAPEPGDGLASLIELGLNHEQQHQELVAPDARGVVAGADGGGEAVGDLPEHEVTDQFVVSGGEGDLGAYWSGPGRLQLQSRVGEET